MDELTKKCQNLQEIQRNLEESNQKLEEELACLNQENCSNDKMMHSYSSNEKKMDLFTSEVDINIIDSVDEDNDAAKKDYCSQCLKMFDLSVQYDINSLEIVLQNEILDFEAQINSQNPRKTEMFNGLFSQIKAVIEQVIKSPFEIYPYGSFASGLNMPWSDIDILLDTLCDQGSESLEHIVSAFSKSNSFPEVKFIKNTSVPVIKLTTSASYDSIKIDITLKDPRHSGLNCVALIQQYLICYPPLKPLALVLKQLMYLGKLNDPYQKGLSSYGLVLMIVAYIQWLIATDNYDQVCGNLGRILLQLLKHYGSSFDYINWKIAPCLSGEIGNPYHPVL